MNKNRIVFVLPVSTQPRFIKRIRNFIKEGYSITVATFERDYLSKNRLPDGIEIITLGRVKAKKYHKRLFSLFLAYIKLRGMTNSQTDLYVLSQDMLIFSFFLKKKKWFYEIGDLRYINNVILNFIYSSLQKIILRNIDCIIVTSPQFKEHLVLRYNIDQNTIHIRENKLSRSLFPITKQLEFKNITNSRFTLGIIGMFRYENIIRFLDAYKKMQPEFNISIWGVGPLKSDIMRYVNGVDIQYLGEFKYHEDLWEIYQKISISFVMYDNNDLNVRLALPNKLYESIYFRRPLIVSNNTYLGEKVCENEIGLVWSQHDMKGLIEHLDQKNYKEEYNQYKEKFEKIDLDNIYE